jgi:Holliday junction resolvasome RuvABC endonuclease subunit
MSHIVLGIDPSSTCCGFAVVKDGEVVEYGHHASNKKNDLGRRIWDFGQFLARVKSKRKFSLVAVEEDSVNRNMNTIRKLAYFESAALSKAGSWGVPTLLLKPNSARKLAFGPGNGNLSKDQVFSILSDRGFEFDDKYGKDESDAITIALAGYEWLKAKN